MALIAIWYMFIHLFALQHMADRPGYYRTYDAHKYLGFNFLDFPSQPIWELNPSTRHMAILLVFSQINNFLVISSIS